MLVFEDNITFFVILCSLLLLQVDNFVHADMHPGNILVRVAQPKNSNNTLKKSRPHVVFLDVGMTAELSSNDRVNLLEFFKAVARRDGRTAAESTLKLSKQQNCPNPKAFIEVIYRYLTTSLFVGYRSLDFIGETSLPLSMIKKAMLQ